MVPPLLHPTLSNPLDGLLFCIFVQLGRANKPFSVFTKHITTQLEWPHKLSLLVVLFIELSPFAKKYLKFLLLVQALALDFTPLFRLQTKPYLQDSCIVSSTSFQLLYHALQIGKVCCQINLYRPMFTKLKLTKFFQQHRFCICPNCILDECQDSSLVEMS